MLLDVGPLMGDLLEPAAKAVSAFIQGKVCPLHAAAAGQWTIAIQQGRHVHRVSAARGHRHAQLGILPRGHCCADMQMINKPGHELQLVFFGTTGEPWI